MNTEFVNFLLVLVYLALGTSGIALLANRVLMCFGWPRK